MLNSWLPWALLPPHWVISLDSQKRGAKEMWQFYLLCLFTNSHGDLINLGEEKHWKTGCMMPKWLLAKIKIQSVCHWFFFMLVFGSFIKGCAKVRWVVVGGGECCLNTGWSSSKCFPGQPVSHRSSSSSSPTSLLPLVLTVLLAGMMERRMEATTGLPPRNNGLPCHPLNVPRDTNLWP